MNEKESSLSAQKQGSAPVVQKINWLAYDLKTVFGIPELPDKAPILGSEPGHASIPEVDAEYVWEIDRLRDMMMFWLGGFKAMQIEGEASAGKTSFIEQWHAKLNVPLHVVPCSPDLLRNELYGGMVPTATGELKWVDGPVLKACKEGSSVLLDEYNTLDGGITTGLNLILEGKSWTVPETGEVIKPARNTRFFTTQNAVDSRAVMAGRNVQDTANDDRFFYLQVDYIPKELEEGAVVRRLKGYTNDAKARQIASVLVTVANDVRQAYRGNVSDFYKAEKKEEFSTAIEKPLSTRALMRWAVLSVLYQPGMAARSKSAIHYAIKRALKMPPAMALAVNEMITMRLGVDEDLKAPA